MKWKEIIITVCVCAILIAAGTFGFSFVYQTVFHPDIILENGSESPSGWQQEKAAYERDILYPFSSAKEEILLRVDAEYLLSDSYHMDEELYSDIFNLADLDWTDIEGADITAYEFRRDTAEYKNYQLRWLFFDIILSEENGNSLVIVVDQDNTPLLFLCKGLNESESFGSYLVEYADLPQKLFDYLAEIDETLESRSSYRSLIHDISDNLPGEGERQIGNLEEYGRYGEWQVYSDSSMAAYVCIIGDKNYILYYDMVSGNFCGYNIALNEF